MKKDMPRFASGVARFQDDVFPKKQDLFEELAKGQAPEVLFITCSDSRIDTAMITQSDPGDLFVCRNAGNIVPPYTEQPGETAAAIEFAVANLKVPHIVVCGHTDCGAMKGAMAPDTLDSLPRVKEWLGFAKVAVDATAETGAGKSEAEQLWLLLEQNVILQLQHLKTHPSVAARLASGDLQLHGWIYDIRTGEVHVFDEQQNKFVAHRERYGDSN